MKILRQIRCLVVLGVILLSVLVILSSIMTRSISNNRNLELLEHRDIQRSVNSFTYLMHPLISEYGASRVALYHLHYNTSGKNNISSVLVNLVGVVTNETKKEESRPLFRVLPIGVYTPVLPHIYDQKAWLCKTKELDQGPLKELLEARDTETSVWLGINDDQGSMIGIISVSWTDKQLIPEKEKYDELLKAMRQVSMAAKQNFALFVDQ